MSKRFSINRFDARYFGGVYYYAYYYGTRTPDGD